jgi:glutaminyl-tRNA synthetase
MYRAAEYLIEAGLAYVDEQTPEEMRANRGDFSKPGVDSPFRSRSIDENLQRFREMRDGKLADGSAVLRAKIDMASPNINMRDPTIYRIKHAEHHNTGDKWCIYPMYTFAHPIEDALENITHSLCTLEFEDQRPFYDWLLDRLAEGGLINTPHPRQYEFARLNLTYVITSKRKLKQLVDQGHVSGWDDPRMPTIVGLRRRGYTPESLQLFAERIGVSKADSVDRLFDAGNRAARRPGPEGRARDGGAGPGEAGDHELGRADGRRRHLEPCSAPVHPHAPNAASASSCSAASCGSSAPTTKRRRPRASSACSRGTRCA